jgi:glycosyltransferase involved in cell wall biosynthesis
MKRPLVSVIMPAYNAARFIGPAIKSVLSQTYKNFELIIVDDGSTDNTSDIVNSFQDHRIVLIRNAQNMYSARSRNIGIDASKGKYIALCDADDLYMPQRLEKQMKYLEDHPAIDIIGCSSYIMNETGYISGVLATNEINHYDIPRSIIRQSPIGHAMLMAKTEWMRTYKYRTKYRLAQDRELFLRAYRYTRFGRIPDVLYVYRVSEKMIFRKTFSSLYYECLMLFQNWKEYGLSASSLMTFLIIAPGRLAFYCVSALFGKNWTWGKLRETGKSSDFVKAQEWIYYCLRRGGHC